MPENFPLSPWFPVRFKEVRIKTLISDYGTGVEQRRNKNSLPGFELSFPLNYLNDTDLSSLYNFYTARLGATQAFNITIKGTVYLVRFKQDGLSWDWFQQNHNKGEVVLIVVAA